MIVEPLTAVGQIKDLFELEGPFVWVVVTVSAAFRAAHWLSKSGFLRRQAAARRRAAVFDTAEKLDKLRGLTNLSGDERASLESALVKAGEAMPEAVPDAAGAKSTDAQPPPWLAQRILGAMIVTLVGLAFTSGAFAFGVSMIMKGEHIHGAAMCAFGVLCLVITAELGADAMGYDVAITERAAAYLSAQRWFRSLGMLIGGVVTVAFYVGLPLAFAAVLRDVLYSTRADPFEIAFTVFLGLAAATTTLKAVRWAHAVFRRLAWG